MDVAFIFLSIISIMVVSEKGKGVVDVETHTATNLKLDEMQGYLEQVLRSEADRVRETLKAELQNVLGSLKSEFEMKANRVLNEFQDMRAEMKDILKAQKQSQDLDQLTTTKDCSPLLVKNAFVNPCTGVIPNGSSATVSCLPGFTIDGESTVTCLEGEYDNTPSCKADCPALLIPDAEVYPTTRVSHGSRVHVECGSTYSLVGNSSPTCIDGSFDEIPSCVFDILGMVATRKSTFQVKEKEDGTNPWITGSEFSSDGQLLLADYHNSKIKLLSSSFKLESAIRIYKPYDVAFINHTTAIVTSKELKLNFVSVVPELKLGKVITLDKQCYGIDVYNDTIYVSCHKMNKWQGHVRLLDMGGNLKGTLGVDDNYVFMFRRPYYLAVSRTSGNVYVSDWRSSKITCLSPAGEVIYTFSHELIKYPDSLILDDMENIIVCGGQSNEVDIITHNNQSRNVLLSAGEVVSSPQSLAFRRSDGTLVVSGYGNEYMTEVTLQTSPGA